MFIEIDKKLLKNIDIRKIFLEQIYYINSSIKKCTIKSEGIEIELIDNIKIDEKKLTAKVVELSNSIIQSFDRVKTTIIFENLGKITSNKDPYNNLIKTRQAIQISPGVFVFQGDFLDTIKQLDNTFKSYALENGAIEQHYPSTVPTKSLIENNYISSF